MTSVIIEDSVFLTNVHHNASRTSSGHEKTLLKVSTRKAPRADSPMTLQACQELGFLPSDLKQKTVEDFKDSTVDEEIVQLRFRHYLKRYNQIMKDVAAARRKIAKGLRNHHTQQLDQQQVPMEGSSPNTVNSYYLSSLKMPKTSHSTQMPKTPLSPLASFLANSMTQNFNKTMNYFRNSHNNADIKSADQIVLVDDSPIHSAHNPSDQLSKTLSQDVFKFNRAKQRKQKEANEIYCQEAKRIEMLKEIEERKKKEKEKINTMIVERKKKVVEKKKLQEEKAEKIREYERNYNYRKEDEKERLNQKLEEARKKYQEENEERKRKIAEREQRLQIRRQAVHEKKSKIDEDEIKMSDQLKSEIEEKFYVTTSNHNRNMSEKSFKMRTKIAKVEESVEKIREKHVQESKDYVQKLAEKITLQEQSLKDTKAKLVKDLKERQTQIVAKGKRFVSNQERLEDHERDRLDEINDRQRKIQESLEIKREADERNRKLQQELLRLKHQDKSENHERIQRQLHNDRMKIFAKDKQIQERIFWLKTQKDLALQASIEMSIQAKLERERIDEAITQVTRVTVGNELTSTPSRGQKKILKDILQPHDYKTIEEKERNKRLANKSQHDQEGTNSTLKPLNSTKKPY